MIFWQTFKPLCLRPIFYAPFRSWTGLEDLAIAPNMIEISPHESLPEGLRNSVVAIGNFDGLHRGHQELLTITRKIAQKIERPWGLLTFEPHPRSFFRPQEPVFRLTPPALKTRLVKALGADFVVNLTFDETLASSSPEDFILRELVERIGLSHVVTGYDFHFGKGRKGGPETLRAMGATHNFGVTVVDQVTDDGDEHAPFSSAARELGYHWTVMGEVVHGDKRGRTIGFPTANIILDPGAEPYRGIYAVKVREAGSQIQWQGAAYFGDRPTFNTNRTFLEVYLLDQDIDLYGKTLMVEFIDMIRGDKAFKSVDELVTQMNQDCADTRKILASDQTAEFPLAKLQAAGKI
jgi:riboflavin kinase / FMN adenylyltransferase